MYKFIPSLSMKVNLTKAQELMLSDKEDIIKIIKNNPDIVKAYDIYEEDELIGFALVRDDGKGEYFLWEYAIDLAHQNMKKGTNALKEFIEFMKANYHMKKMTTTYIYGNDIAKHVYEKIGFKEFNEVIEETYHEFDMEYYV